jgi:hypothetical protein
MREFAKHQTRLAASFNRQAQNIGPGLRRTFGATLGFLWWHNHRNKEHCPIRDGSGILQEHSLQYYTLHA